MAFSTPQSLFDVDFTLFDNQLEYELTDTGIDWGIWHLSELLIGGTDWKQQRNARVIGNKLVFNTNPYTVPNGTVATARIKSYGIGVVRPVIIHNPI